MKTETRVRAVGARCEVLLDNVSDYVALHARARPLEPALIEHHTGEVVSPGSFDRAVNARGAKLISSGFLKGGRASPRASRSSKEHVILPPVPFP